jgi:hypothetical protein
VNEIVEILALLVVGTLLGSEFAVAAFFNPLVGRLPDEAFRAVRSDGSRLLGRVMPFWYLTSFALLVGVGAVGGRWWLIGAGAGLMVIVVLLSVAVLVPINNRIGDWGGADEVSRGLAARWDRLHWVRVALLAAAFVLLAIGVVNM